MGGLGSAEKRERTQAASVSAASGHRRRRGLPREAYPMAANMCWGSLTCKAAGGLQEHRKWPNKKLSSVVMGANSQLGRVWLSPKQHFFLASQRCELPRRSGRQRYHS